MCCVGGMTSLITHTHTHCILLQVIFMGEELSEDYPPEVWEWIHQVEREYEEMRDASNASSKATCVAK